PPMLILSPFAPGPLSCRSFNLTPPLPSSTLFPYTTLFRSLPIMSLFGCYELDAAVAVLRVVPSHEAQHPLACLIDRSKRLLRIRSEEHTSELQSRENIVCRLPLVRK